MIAIARIVLASVLLAPASFAQMQVFVVAAAGGPGVFSTEIQPAVDAALDGDVVLVRSGAYSGFDVLGKAITVIADKDANVKVFGRITIADVSSAPGVLLRRFDVRSFDDQDPPPAVTLMNNAAPVCLENMKIQPGAVLGIGAGLAGATAVRIDGCASVWLRACTLTGGSGVFPEPAIAGGDALQSADTSLYLLGTNCFGGKGLPSSIAGVASRGGAGVRFTSGFLYEQGSWNQGGVGGDVLAGIALGGAGGIALVIGGEAHLKFTSTIGALGGHGTLGVGPTGADSVVLPRGTLHVIPGAEHHFEAISPVVEGTTAFLTFVGPVGDTAFYVLARAPEIGTFLPALQGVLLVPLAGSTIYAAGVIPPVSILQFPLQTPMLPPGVQGMQLEFQSLYFDGALGQFVLGPASNLLILDQNL